MSNFVANDLLRRKFQTSLVIITLTLSVASTLFLLFFSNRLGFNASKAVDTLTLGLASIFSEFTIYMGILVFVIGAVLTSFIAFLMMAQRTRDFGLIKAAGCPNSLVAGYFITELIITTVSGCSLGVALGFFLDYVATNIVFSSYLLPNFLFAPAVFIAFIALSMIFGLSPIIKASKMSPSKALSPVEYYGLNVAGKQKTISRLGLKWRIASRSLYRRQSTNIRLIILLSLTFVLLTTSIAGGIIARDTTTSWIRGSIKSNTIAIATNIMGNQYERLLSTFVQEQATENFNYSDPKLGVPQIFIQKLNGLPGVSLVDSRLVLKGPIKEVANFTFNSQTSETLYMGDSRQGDSVIIGVNPSKLASNLNIEGRFLNSNNIFEAVIGDSIAQSMYSPDQKEGINQSNPLAEGISFENSIFNIVGVCVDPTNNGLVTYVNIDRLKNITEISSPNIILVTLNNSFNQSDTISQIKTLIASTDPGLNVFRIDDIVNKDAGFLSSNWQTIMTIPLFALASAAFCLVGYMMLAANEQRHDFGVLRAVGAKPRIVVIVLAIQSLVMLLASFGVGILFGTILTVIILMQQPLITIFTMLQIIGLLLAALTSMFLLSLYPAFQLSKSNILKILTQ